MKLPIGATRVLNKGSRFVTTNSPAILTAVGVVGIVGTVIVTYRQTTKANKVLANEQYQRNIKNVTPGGAEPLNRNDKIKLTWKCYAPVVGIASLSIAAVIGAQFINTKRAAALAAGYMLLNDKHEEYREKVEEMLGKKKASDIDEAVAQDLQHKSGDRKITVHTGDVLCQDALTRQYFSSNMEQLRKAENTVNANINHGDQPSVTDLFTAIGKDSGLENTRLTDAFGWNEANMCEMKLVSVLNDEGVPVLLMDFSVLPIGNHWKVDKDAPVRDYDR